MSPRVRGALERLGLVALGVGLDTAAMPPGPAPALVFVADAPFLWLLWHRGGAHWKRWAFFYGFVRFAVGLRWLAEVHWAQVIGASAILAVTYLAWGAALRFLARRGVPFPLAVGVTAVLQEMSQTVVVLSSGMPWPARSLAFTGWPWLLGAACELGAYGLSFLAALTSAWVSGLPAALRPSPWRREHVRRLIAAGFPILLLLGAATARGAFRISSVDRRLEAHAAFLTDDLVLVQGDVAQALKHAKRGKDEDPAKEIFDRHIALTRRALDWFVDHRRRPIAVLWPETMVPYDFLEPALVARRGADHQEIREGWESEFHVIQHVRMEACPPGLVPPFLLGANYYFRGRTGDHDRVRDYDTKDSLFLVDPDSLPEEVPNPDATLPTWVPPWQRPEGRHDKAVLVPWGEYTPFGEALPFLRKGRDLVSVIPEITPGDRDQAPFLLGEVAPAEPGHANRPVLAGTVICFELAFPARCRAWRSARATVLLNAGNYGWFGDTGMPAQVMALGRLRAVELAMTVAIAGNTGPTAILDPAGRTVAQVEEGGRTQFVEGTCHGPLWCDPDYETTYARFGDAPWWALGAGILAWAVFRGRRTQPAGDPGSAVAAPPAGGGAGDGYSGPGATGNPESGAG